MLIVIKDNNVILTIKNIHPMSTTHLVPSEESDCGLEKMLIGTSLMSSCNAYNNIM